MKWTCALITIENFFDVAFLFHTHQVCPRSLLDDNFHMKAVSGK